VLAHSTRAAATFPRDLCRLVLVRSAADFLAAAPRFVPHCLVLGAALIAVISGGFTRPNDAVATLAGIGSEEGALSANGRFVLGPRAAEVQIRDALVRPSLTTTQLAPSAPRAEVVTSKVQPGDTIWDIGARFNVGSYSVLWSNGLDEDAIIKPGQDLKIPPIPGTLHTVSGDDNLDGIARKYNVEPAVIVDFNRLRPGEGLTQDKLLVIPGGQLPVARRIAPVLLPPVIRPPVQTLPLPLPSVRTAPPVQAPAPVQAQRPTLPIPAPAPVAPTGRLSWPTRGVITTYFSGWHPGIDIAAAVGTAIGAADGGTVTFTGWDNTGYGYRVVISHGNGYSTTYNHLSSIGVRAGQGVSKGQQIGGMGSTGRSTGSHLHFEILRNGGFVNPLGVLG
ncbi:MAG TPA: M23 family metallopeptidase, partial [Chloroflexota bacterium]|nr:M23 family metallopeptidase [Chloroflexota bacterium]